MSNPKRILFFDGDCGLCRRSIRILIRLDHNRRMYFSPLQGETAKRLLAEPLRTQLDSIVYRTSEGHSFSRSNALIRYLKDCGGIFHIPAAIIGLLPRSMMDQAYDWIAGRRHRFAPGKSCSLNEAGADKRMLP